MSEGARGALLALLLAASAGAHGNEVQWSGYYKNLLVQSDTLAGEPFTLDTNRLRVEVKGSITPALRLDLQYDNELLLGNYLRTAQFQQLKDMPPPQYWRADANYLETSRLYGTHRLYRAKLTLSAGDTDVHLGRQRVAWGTGRFWSPLDVLNPLSATALEREERPGVDAVLVEHKVGPLSKVSAVGAPSRTSGRSTAAVQWHDNRGGLDYSLTAGRLQGRLVWGIDLAGQIGQAGVRAEMTHERPRDMPAYNRVLLGADYAFANTLTLTAELFFNGAGARDPSAYDFRALLSGQLQALGRRYLGAHASYKLTPLLKLDNELAVNLADHSRYAGIALTYSLQPNLDVRVGVQRFGGGASTEFARLPAMTYLNLQSFF